MIIKKKLLNKINGLGDIPGKQAEANFQEPQNTTYYEGMNQGAVTENSEQEATVESSRLFEAALQSSHDDIDIFNLDNIDFTQRKERRRGDRRRGFRRVDDRNLVSRAREEADSIRKSAVKEGYQAGLAQVQEDMKELKGAVAQFMNAPNEVFEYIAPDILEISVDIAQKIIKKEIEQDPQVLFNTIVEVLKTLAKEEPKITIQVSPAEENEVKQSVPELLSIAGLSTKVIVLPDETITEGGCLVTTDNGVVDATLETRINMVIEALREM